MQLISRSSESHWYRWIEETGSILPCYETPRADGEGMRKTTLADARKEKLLVGISTIANMLPKPALTAWLQEKAIYAALTLPRLPDEPLDEFAKRAVIDMTEQTRKAADFGTEIHDAIFDKLLAGIKPPEHLDQWVQGFREWADKNIEDVHALEFVVGDPALGVAGRLDADVTLREFGRTIIDAKTQGIKNGKPNYYDTFPVQLAGYRHCRQRECPEVKFRICSLVIDSATPGPCHANVWLGDDGTYWKIFQNCLENWQYQNNIKIGYK